MQNQSFQEAIKTDKGLQQEVAQAIQQIAQKHNLSLPAQSGGASVSSAADCVSTLWTAVCTA
ncbi:hypothetical protein [Flaviaesturariibacter flavus]|uniref:hypothetical protein n=1 Tax=Flaviaesturariibacter flavus TaxID=2502780 RepID=UPI0014042A68|nr:hypothetical protein [Flaviaesturariibacter flavus]